MKKKLIVTSLVIATMLTGCNSDTTTTDNNTNTTFELNTTTANQTESSETSVDEETVSLQSQEADSSSEASFEILSEYSYEFCSGAGGWSTNFNIEKDGYFHGNYHDSDMGDNGDDYPNGTLYSSSFSGHFKDLIKIDDYTYEMTMSDITYANEPGQEEIDTIEGIKIIYSEAYGLTGTDKFLVHLAGKPVNEISEEVYTWLSMVNGDSDVLTFPCIENADQQEGIYSYERMNAAEEAQMTYDSYKSSYDYFVEENEELNNTYDFLQNAQKRYELADNLLNEIWILVKYNTDEDTFNSVLNEQREWLKQRDSAAQEGYDSWEGGSFAPVDYADTQATMTMERCEELLKLLKD